jgi:hypothetical protein
MNNCTSQFRLIFDVGSGKTKFSFWGVDSCTNATHLIIRSKITMPYQAYIINGTLSEEGITQGITTFEKVQEECAISCALIPCFGIATAWARNAQNSKDYLQKIKDTLHIEIHTISQEQEGQLVFKAVEKELPHLESSTLIVCEVGGGSFQISFRKPDSEIVVVEGGYGGENYHLTLQQHLNSSLDAEGLPDRYYNKTELPYVQIFQQEKVVKFLKNNQELQEVANNPYPIVLTLTGEPLYIVTREALIATYKNDSIISAESIKHVLSLMPNFDLDTAKQKFSLIPDVTKMASILSLVGGILEGMDFVNEVTFINPDTHSFLATDSSDILGKVLDDSCIDHS